MSLIRYLAIGLALIALWTPQARACGQHSDCMIASRSYRIALPDGPPKGAIIYIHGYRGKAANVMKHKALTGLAGQLGVAFVAAQAAGPEWNIPGVPSVDTLPGVDELEYFDALAADLEAHFGIAPGRMLVTGFSSGAMMVWQLACQRGDRFAGYVPMSGSFWEPVPKSCPGGAVNLIHYHGTQDPVVPLAGQQIKDGHQGDVRKALAMMARVGGFGPAEAAPEEGLDCTREADGKGHRLELCLFEGKHQFKVRHIVRAWEAFHAGG